MASAGTRLLPRRDSRGRGSRSGPPTSGRRRADGLSVKRFHGCAGSAPSPSAPACRNRAGRLQTPRSQSSKPRLRVRCLRPPPRSPTARGEPEPTLARRDRRPRPAASPGPFLRAIHGSRMSHRGLSSEATALRLPSIGAQLVRLRDLRTSLRHAASNVHFQFALYLHGTFIGSARWIPVSCISRCVPLSRASRRLTSESSQKYRCRTRRALLRSAVPLCRSPRAPGGNPPEVGTGLALRRFGNSD